MLVLIRLLPALVASHARMNVLFLASDDMRIQLGASRVSGTHRMSTPHIDALIQKSLFLRRAQVQQAVCSPTRTSLLTSRYPDTTRVWDLYSYFRDVGGNFTTLPQLFREQGYLTTGGGKIFHPGHASGGGVGHGSGDDSLYSWSTPFFHAPSASYWGPAGACSGCGNSWISVSPAAERAVALPDTQIAQNAIASLANFSREGVGRRRAGSRPFFLAAGFHKPHLPFVAPQHFFERYPLDEIELPTDQQPPMGMPRVAWSDWGELRNYADIAALHVEGKPGQTLPRLVTKELRRAYYAAVSFTDHNVGLVVSALEAHGYANNTVVSFWGDHGWQLGEHGEWCKHTNFDLATSAPMFLHIPGLTDAGVVTSTPTEYLDLMPTLAEAAMGISVPACPADAAAARHVALCTHGVSLLPLIAQPAVAVKVAAYSQYPRGYVRPGEESEAIADLDLSSQGFEDTGEFRPSGCLSRRCTMGYSLLTVRSGTEYRYTEWVDFNTKVRGGPDWGRVIGSELYDHASDPLENVNLAKRAVPEALVRDLRRLLRAHPAWASASTWHDDLAPAL